MKYPIPKQSAQALEKISESTNPGLLFDRFIPALVFADGKEEEAKWKRAGFDNAIKHHANKKALENYKTRWEKVITEANAASFKMKTDWRFIAGLGRKGALEVGFTFHRYGFAMLPGSSVKGIARAFAFYRIAEELDLEGEKLTELDVALSQDNAEKHKERMQALSRTDGSNETVIKFRKVFGTTGEAGGAVFFDAIPQNPPRLKLDIMNPHYPDYYSDKSNTVYPTNWQNPNPVFFLTVDESQEFCFAVGWRGRFDDNAKTLRLEAEKWLMGGLTELGAGAKTSAGYGYWHEIK